MLERHVENPVCAYAKDRGWWALKLKILSIRGFPDRMFLGAGARIFFVEFKAPGEKLRANQVSITRKLGELGFRVYVCDDAVVGKEIVERETHERDHQG